MSHCHPLDGICIQLSKKLLGGNPFHKLHFEIAVIGIQLFRRSGSKMAHCK